MATRRPRSPRYPQLPLREAIDRVGKVYRANRAYKVEKESVAKALGYGSVNGASVSLIGTLKSYGLLREDKEGVQVTENAVTILRAPDGDPEKAEALRNAAFEPKIFADLREAYGENLDELPIETTLQYRLEKRGFLEKAAVEVIRTYRDNLEFVSEESAEYTDVDDPVDEPPAEVPEMQPARTMETPLSPPPSPPAAPSGVGTPAPAIPVEQGSLKEYLHIFARDCEMRLYIDGVPTQEAIDRLIGYLNLGKEDLPSREELESTAKPPAAEPTTIEMPPPE